MSARLLTPAALEMFWARTPNQSADECWEWLGWTDKNGYGNFDLSHDGGRIRYAAHRVACELENGLAPANKNSACHTCHNPACVNPGHLYWGDHKDNARDCVDAGRHVPGGRTGVTVCINGHDYTPENTYWEPRGRACKECRREAVRRYRAKRAQERAA